MTWKRVGDAVELFEGVNQVGSMKHTSSSTVLLRTTRGFSSSIGLRLYSDHLDLAGDLPTGSSTLWYAEHEPTTACVRVEGAWVGSYLTWMDGATEQWTGLPIPEGSLDLAIRVSGGSTPRSGSHRFGDTTADNLRWLLRTTCVPGVKRADGWPYMQLTYGQASDGTRYFDATTETADFWVIYKDPCVVEVPGGGGWLMLLKRIRVHRVDVAANDPELARNEILQADTRLSKPGGCYADVVAYWAPDPSFTDGLVGPFLMVHSLDALDFDHRRAWLGVPGGTFVNVDGEDWLYLYYVVEAHDPGAGAVGAEAAEPVVEEDDPHQYWQRRTKTVVWTEAAWDPSASYSSYNVSRTDTVYGPESLAPVTRGIAVRRVRLSDLSVAFSGPAVTEDCWRTDRRSCGWSGVVPGENLGLVRLWMAPERAGGAVRVRAFGSVFPEVREADPMPVVCDDGAMALYFSAIGDAPTSTSGHGVWRAAGLPEGQPFTRLAERPTPYTAIFGVDFVMSAESDPARGAVSIDQIVASSGTSLFIDPDPVRLPDGSVRVFVGEQISNVVQPLLRYDGSAEDACRGWAELFSVAEIGRASPRVAQLIHGTSGWTPIVTREGQWTPLGAAADRKVRVSLRG